MKKNPVVLGRKTWRDYPLVSEAASSAFGVSTTTPKDSCVSSYYSAKSSSSMTGVRVRYSNSEQEILAEWVTSDSKEFAFYPPFVEARSDVWIVSDETQVWLLAAFGYCAYCLYAPFEEKEIEKILSHFNWKVDNIYIALPSTVEGKSLSEFLCSVLPDTNRNYKTWNVITGFSNEGFWDLANEVTYAKSGTKAKMEWDEALKTLYRQLVREKTECANGTEALAVDFDFVGGKPLSPKNCKETYMPKTSDSTASLDREKIASIVRKPSEQAQFLVEHLAEFPLKRFLGEGYIVIKRQYKGKEICQPMRITNNDRTDFTRYCEIFMEKNGLPLSPEARLTVFRRMDARAAQDGENSPFPLRVIGQVTAKKGHEIYIDMANDSYQTIEVTKHGWQIVEDSPVLFRRTDGQNPIPEPVRVKNQKERNEIWARFEQLLRPGSEENWVLMVSWVINCFFPFAEYAGICINGPSNSGKSLRSVMLRLLSDPHKTEILPKLRDVRELAANVNDCHALALGNLSAIPADISDALCTISSDGFMSLREMRTNLGLERIESKRPMLLNGITEFITQSDLKRRFFFVQLPIMRESEQQDERIIKKEFWEIYPRLLGCILDALVVGLSNIDHPEVVEQRYNGGLIPVGRFVTACAMEESGLPWYEKGSTYFQDIYSSNREQTMADNIDGNIGLIAVIDYLKSTFKDIPADKYGVKQYQITGNQFWIQSTRFARYCMVDRHKLRAMIQDGIHHNRILRTNLIEEFDKMETYEIIGYLGSYDQEKLESEAARILERNPRWPKVDSAFGGLIKREANTLNKLGYEFTKRKEARFTGWTITKVEVD